MAPGRTSHLRRLREQEQEAARAQEANQSSAANATSATAAVAPSGSGSGSSSGGGGGGGGGALLPPTDSVALTTTTDVLADALDNPLSALLNATGGFSGGFAFVANLSRAAVGALATGNATGAAGDGDGALTLTPGVGGGHGGAHLVGWDYFNISDGNSSWGNANSAGAPRCTPPALHAPHGSRLADSGRLARAALHTHSNTHPPLLLLTRKSM